MSAIAAEVLAELRQRAGQWTEEEIRRAIPAAVGDAKWQLPRLPPAFERITEEDVSRAEAFERRLGAVRAVFAYRTLRTAYHARAWR